MKILDRFRPASRFASAFVFAVRAFCASSLFADDPVPLPNAWLNATAHCIPKETATEGEGYFAIVEGKNGRLYIGTHGNAVNSWLVEFDPASAAMNVVVDVHQAIGKDLRGFGAQSKIHSRNNTGDSGKIYFATKQGYQAAGETYTDYPGGYPMVYDPATGGTKVYPIPVPHQGVISITPDESRGIAYISTCSDGKPGPHESAHFMVLDLNQGTYRDLVDSEHIYAFIVIDHRGRAYHPLRGGDIACYDPETGTLHRLKHTIDGQSPSPESHSADPEGHPINWDIDPKRTTLYSVPMNANQLYAYDLAQEGDTLNGRGLGSLVPGATATDCRAMCVGPTGEVWVAVTEPHPDVGSLLHLVSYKPGDAAPRDRGPVAVVNPDFTVFTDAAGNALPFHGGFVKLKNGRTTTRYVILGVCQGRDGAVNVLALHPYSVLRIEPDQLR
ncbi:MAG TPA: hypothetical protein VND64_03210 [Pirellulales bacterium]|nr:hypothetical protein [Pirellulales bacterium]